MKEGVLLLSWIFLLLEFWLILLDGTWTINIEHRLSCNGDWCPTFIEHGLQQILFNCSLLSLFPSGDTKIWILLGLIGLCFSDSGKLINFNTSFTLPRWLSAVILPQSYLRHMAMNKSSINPFSLRSRLKRLCNHTGGG